MYFIYVLRCADSSLYCGYTSDMEHRIRAHMGKIAGGAKYTRSRRPVRVERVWKTESREGAMRFECAIKKLGKMKKESLISDPDSCNEVFGAMIAEYLIVRAEDFVGDIVEADCGNVESVARMP